MRLLAGALVVCLVVAPAVVRATRVFDTSGRPSIALSFKHSFEDPPDAADAPPDLAVEPVVRAAFALVPSTSAEPTPAPVRAVETLRGPPVDDRS
ncbi:MAG TPA: hypothetical protein VFZ98_01610 [Vicinamibacterales bacterium]